MKNQKINVGLMYSDNNFPSPINKEVTFGWSDSTDSDDENSPIIIGLLEDERFNVFNFRWQDVNPDMITSNLYNLDDGENLKGSNLNEVLDIIFFKGFGKQDKSRSSISNIDQLLTEMSKKLTIPTINPISIVQKNRKNGKMYLFSLQEDNIPIPLSKIANSLGEVLSIGNELGEYVTKPVFGFGGTENQKFPNDNYDLVNKILQRDSKIIVQKFIPDIYEGERSIYLFNNEFKYAVLKKPKDGDFRSNADFSTITDYNPVDNEIRLAKDTISALGYNDAIIVRVDIAGRKENPLVMEVTKSSMGLYPKNVKDKEKVPGYVKEVILSILNKN